MTLLAGVRPHRKIQPGLTTRYQMTKIPLAAQPPMVYDIAGSHSHIESAKIWSEFRLTHENNRRDLVYDRSERKDSTAG